ncbi:MAG: polyprenyl synthetase family protein [Fimbriimonas sp.]
MTASALKAMTEGRIRPELLAQITDEVSGVEQELQTQMRSKVRLVNEVCKHTLEAGGKRLRPAFVALAARATGDGFSSDRARKLGACMEMIHMATLMHDDVVDNAATRRGRETASARFGNTGAILSGDVLLAKSMAILAQDGDLEIIRVTSDMVVQMAEGEVRELEVRGDFDLSAEAHVEVLRLKTASFIECCCEVGALATGASPEIRRSLREYGYHVGLAFQIVDDLLDYRGDRTKIGKQLATDFREGCATYPLIFLRPYLSEAESQMARRRFGNGVSDDEIRMICDWMDTRGAFAESEAKARTHVDQALEAMSRLPETPARELLETVAEYVLLRQT